MKRLKTMANELLELAESMEEWDKYIDKIRKPQEDGKLVAIINERNEFITKLLALDLETRFQYSERPVKAQNKWFQDNWGVTASTLDFYRSKKNKSIARQYSELDDKAKELVNEEVEDLYIEEPAIEDKVENPYEESQVEEGKKEEDIVSKEKRLSNNLSILNHRDIEENSPWDDSSLNNSNLDLLEPFHHTPYKYGDIMEDGRVFVWKGKFITKEIFFKSYMKSKFYLSKKRELKLSVPDISKKTGLSKATVNNALYYPYIKCTDLMIEQFDRKFQEVLEEYSNF